MFRILNERLNLLIDLWGAHIWSQPGRWGRDQTISTSSFITCLRRCDRIQVKIPCNLCGPYGNIRKLPRWIIWECHSHPCDYWMIQEEYKNSMKEVCEFSTLEDFWRNWMFIPKPRWYHPKPFIDNIRTITLISSVKFSRKEIVEITSKHSVYSRKEYVQNGKIKQIA